MIFFLLAFLLAVTANGGIDNNAMDKGNVPCSGQNKHNCRPGGDHDDGSHQPARPCTKMTDCERSGGKKAKHEAEEFHGPDHGHDLNDNIHRRPSGGNRGGRGRGRDGNHDGRSNGKIWRHKDTRLGGHKVLS